MGRATVTEYSVPRHARHKPFTSCALSACVYISILNTSTNMARMVYAVDSLTAASFSNLLLVSWFTMDHSLDACAVSPAGTTLSAIDCCLL